MESVNNFDIIVIGAGMIGAAAGRYLSQPDHRVAIFGPTEPANWESHAGVFASHYDQGRITRMLDPDPIWAWLAKRSIENYATIENTSGIRFHHKTGGLRVTYHIEKIKETEQVGQDLKAVFQVHKESLAEDFPYFHFDDGCMGISEAGQAGYINPRSLVAAQLIIAEQQGAMLIREVVTGISQASNSIEVRTSTDQVFRAAKVLVAAGAYSGWLLDVTQQFERKARTILMAELSESEVEHLKEMPTLIADLPNSPDLPNVYVLPPIQYADGKSYIKLGGETVSTRHITEQDDLNEHFRSGGNPQEAEALKDALHQLLPGLQIESYQFKPCVITDTATGYPYIDRIEDGIYIAAGGNGASAKSSNEIGRIASRLVEQGVWDTDLAPTSFQMQ